MSPESWFPKWPTLSLAVPRRCVTPSEMVNKREDIKNLVIFSMDIYGFYPALNIDECARTSA